jgi:hypothetical protein
LRMLNNSIISLLDCFADFRNGQREPIPALFFGSELFYPLLWSGCRTWPGGRLGYPHLELIQPRCLIR